MEVSEMLASEISFFLLFFLCSCNNNNTGTSTQFESNTTPELKAVFIAGEALGKYVSIEVQERNGAVVD